MGKCEENQGFRAKKILEKRRNTGMPKGKKKKFWKNKKYYRIKNDFLVYSSRTDQM